MKNANYKRNIIIAKIRSAKKSNRKVIDIGGHNSFHFINQTWSYDTWPYMDPIGILLLSIY